MKQRIRLSESKLRNIIKESVKRILKESEWEFDALNNEPPTTESTVGSEEWFEDEFDPKYSQVGHYENMSPEFVDWANMNDEENDYDAEKSWDNHFRKLENDRSWGQFDDKRRHINSIHKFSKHYPEMFGNHMPKRNNNIYNNH